MQIPEIEEFSRSLVKHVRDAAIRNCDGQLQPNAASPIARRWQLSEGQPFAYSVMIPDVVDETVFFLLQAIDQGLMRMKYLSSSGREIDLTEEGLGELSGWYMGSGGWRAMFSQERFKDDFADLS